VGKKPKIEGKVESKIGGPKPKTGGKLRPISIPNLGDRSHCVSCSNRHALRATVVTTNSN